jgi:hypothetical protein
LEEGLPVQQGEVMITEPFRRNSGALLEPCVRKSGLGCYQQGVKMQKYPGIFAPVWTADYTTDSYVMPALQEPVIPYDYVTAFAKLKALWEAGVQHVPEPLSRRERHHREQVEPLATNELAEALSYWWSAVRSLDGLTVHAVHGDPTLENIMSYNAHAVWIDPSTRTTPLEAEFDAAKILQSVFGYDRLNNDEAHDGHRQAIKFVQDLNIDWSLTGYYLVTHLVRLYKVQPQARAWAVDLALHLEERMEELRCKSLF